MKIIAFDSTNTISTEYLGVDCTTIVDQHILEDILGLQDKIRDAQKVFFISNIFNEKIDLHLNKLKRQVVNLIDTCLFLEIPMIIILPFTPYYGNTQMKTIYETTIYESSDLDYFSLFIHEIGQEVERGRQEGGIIAFIRTGLLLEARGMVFDLAIKHKWRAFPTLSRDSLQKILSDKITDKESENINLIFVDKLIREENFNNIITHKRSVIYRIKSLINKEKYDLSIPIKIEALHSISK